MFIVHIKLSHFVVIFHSPMLLREPSFKGLKPQEWAEAVFVLYKKHKTLSVYDQTVTTLWN